MFCGHYILTSATQSIVIKITGNGLLYTTKLNTGLVHVLLHLEIILAPLTLSHTVLCVVHIPIGTWLLIRLILNWYEIAVADHALFICAKEVFFFLAIARLFRRVTIATEIYVDCVLLCGGIQIDIAYTLILPGLLNCRLTEWLLFAKINSAFVVKEHVLVVIHLLLTLTFSRVVKACSGGIHIHDLRWSHGTLNSWLTKV